MSLPRDKTFENESKGKKQRAREMMPISLDKPVQMCLFRSLFTSIRSLSPSSSSSSFAIQQNFLRLLSLKNKNHISRFILFHSLFVWRRTNLWFNKSFAFFLSFSQFIKFVFLCLWIDEKQIKIFFFIYWSIRISFLWTIPSIIRLSLINKQHTLHFFSSPSFLLSLSLSPWILWKYCEWIN